MAYPILPSKRLIASRTSHHLHFSPRQSTLFIIPGCLNGTHGYSTRAEKFSPDFDPYNYTAGRWLIHDQAQREARYIKFDFDALCNKVVELCDGATSIRNCGKVDNNGFYRRFRFSCDNGKQVVAKLPTPGNGQLALVTHSEVATIDYLQRNTTIPIPKVLGWSDNQHNSIGHQYIISEQANGIQLAEKWPDMSEDQKSRCNQAIYQKNLAQAAALNFRAYGSLYFSDMKARLNGNAVHIDGDFIIGPQCGRRYWTRDVGGGQHQNSINTDTGPWLTLPSYADGLINATLWNLPAGGTCWAEGWSTETYTAVLYIGRKILQALARNPQVENAATAVLDLSYMSQEAIYVSEDDPTTSTAFTDWQYKGVVPAFECLSKDIQALEKGTIPKLSDAMELDKNMRFPFTLCDTLPSFGIIPLRNAFLSLSQKWTDLGMRGHCPYLLPDAETLRNLDDERKAFATWLVNRNSIMTTTGVSESGWVRADRYEAAVEAHQQYFDRYFDGYLKDMMEDEEEKDKSPAYHKEIVQSAWPFNVWKR